MYQEIQSFDIKNRPRIVHANLSANVRALSNDLYILVKGNNFEIPRDIQADLLRLARQIDGYFQK